MSKFKKAGCNLLNLERVFKTEEGSLKNREAIYKTGRKFDKIAQRRLVAIHFSKLLFYILLYVSTSAIVMSLKF